MDDTSRPESFSAFIFDLGNVVIDYSFDLVFEVWAHAYNRDVDDLKRKFAFDESFERFERGDMSPAEYRAHVGDLLGLDFADEVFDTGWNALYVGLKPGIADILMSLRDRYRLVALTNTTPLHVPVWRKLFTEALSLFEKVFASSEIGARKPEPEAFLAVLDYLGAEPGEVLFFDDNPEFVRGAQELGITALKVSSSDEIRSSLMAFDIRV